jgi:hypothetical protein
MTGNRYDAMTGRMLELAVAPFLSNLDPTVVFNQLEHVAHFHD